MKKVRIATAAFILSLGVCQALWAVSPPRKVKPKKIRIETEPAMTIPAGQDYFKPQLRLSGIGADRKGMTEAVLQAREKQLIQSATFSIMRDPRALKWAQAINSPKLQEIFSRAAQEHDFPKATLEAISFVESGGDPDAQSPTGPKGIMQFTGRTGERAGLKKRYETRVETCRPA